MEGNTLVHKTCRCCKKSKPIDAYNTRGKKNPHLLQSECKECRAKSTRRYRELNVEKRLWSSAKTRAKRFNLPFDLDVSDIVVPLRCPVLGITIDPSYTRRTDNSPSVDKVIPELGYVKGNVVVISWRANRLKSDASLDELRRITSFYQQFISEVGSSHATETN